MAQNRSFGLPLAMLLLAGLSSVAAQATAWGVAGAQATANAAVSRLAGDWHTSPPVVLHGSKPPAISGSIDEGAASANQSLGRMILLLSPSAVQQQALAAHLAAVQDPSSPLYHQWLSASSFADAYSVSAADATAVSAWLQAQGFQVAALPAGRGWVEFTGTVAQVEQAFNAQIYMLATVSGASRAVLAGDISIPAALQPVIAGLVSLDGAISTPALTAPRPLSISAADLAAQTSLTGAQALTPQLAAQLLNFKPLTAAGVTGSGQTIAIASRSNVNTADVAAFRAAFGLPTSQLNVTLDGADPGLTDAQADATLAASWAGAAAPGAQIILVPDVTSNATDGVDLSLAAIVDGQLATTAVAGYSSCEAALSPAHQAFYSTLYSQAAAEGITVIAAAGDSGASACSLPGSTAPVTAGYGVNALASTPWNTAVGVAAFGSSGPAAGALAAWSPAATADPAYAGGGGSSTLHAIPAWQPVPPQLQPGASASLPNRLLPDLSLPTAIDSTASPGLAFCLSAGSGSNGCTLVRSGGSAASASIFAGIAALIAQKYGTQGNLAPHLYALSAQKGVFTDVAQGSAQLPCAAGTPGCDASGEIGYTAQSGYDLATGLGVPDADALVTNFASPQGSGTEASTVALTISPSEPGSIYNPAALLTLTATVTSGTGGPVPTQTVTFLDQTNGQPLGTAGLNGSGVAAVAVEGDFALGANSIIAEYSGDTVYAAQNSAPMTITTQASTTSLTLTPSATSVSPGQDISVTVTLTVGTPPAPGITPSGVVTLNLDGSSVGTEPLVASGSTFTATFPSVTVPTGSATSHTLQATYPSSTDFATSTSGTVTLTVSKITTTLTISPASLTPAANASLVVTATINPAFYASADPTGTVEFTLDGANVGSGTVSAADPSTATFTIPNVTAGTHTLGGSYNGDDSYAGSTATAVTINASKISTTLTISPASFTPTPNASLVVTATINPANYASNDPTGTVEFTLDGANVGSGTVSAADPSTATFTIPNITAGTHTLGGSYNGDNSYAGSTATAVTITSSKITTTLTISPASLTPTGNSSLMVTATINPANYGSANPTGTITFTLDGVSAGSSTVTSGQPSTATFTIPDITPGTHTLGGSYNGDTSYAASTAQTVTINAARAATVTTLTSTPSPLVSVTPVSFTATVAPANAVAGTTYTLTGTVSFYDGNSLLGTATVNGDSATLSGITLSATTSHTIKAVYSGDTSWLSSTSNLLTLAATSLLDNVVLTANYTVAPPGVAVILTATVTPAVPPLPTAEQNPTGTVVFLDGTTVIGTATLVPVANSDASVATFITQLLPAGLDTLTASYSGDATYAAEVSLPITITVQNFTITPCASNPLTNLNIVQGGAGSECFNISGQAGFAGVLQIICTVATQDDMTCTASPQQITPPATVTFVVQTTTANAIVKREAAPPLWPQAMGGTALAAIFFFLVPFGRRARAFSRRYLILLMLLVGLVGAGIGCTSTGGVENFGTPLGVATIKITASAYIDDAVVSQSTFFTVNVTAP